MRLFSPVILFTADQKMPTSSPYTLQDLRAPHGVFAVLGNHDYAVNYSGDSSTPGVEEIVIAALERAGITVLRNEETEIVAGRSRLQLYGIDELWSGRAQVSSIARHFFGVPPDRIMSQPGCSAISPGAEYRFGVVWAYAWRAGADSPISPAVNDDFGSTLLGWTLCSWEWMGLCQPRDWLYLACAICRPT